MTFSNRPTTDHPEAIQPTFVSNAMKTYVATMLKSRKQWSLERIVATLYSRPSSPEAIEHLPQYLDTLGKPRDLINYLTLDHLTGACKSSNSLQPIKGLLKSGMRASQQEGEATDGKLPWPEGITHQGYSLVLAACRLQIQDATENQWRELVKAVDAIPNRADQVLIMAIIADHAPSKLNEMRAGMLLKAQNLVKTIPSPIDQIGRLEAIASSAASFDKERAKSCLQDATELVSRAKDFRDDDRRRRSIIDVAHRIDSDFAVSLADKLDEDPAIQKRRKVGGRNKLKTILKELGDGEPEEKLAGLTAEETVELCEMMLPGLHDNSIANVRVPRIAEFISRFASLPFQDISGALAWVIENSVQVHMNTPYGKTHLVQLFGACASACELSIRLMSWAAGYQYGDSPVAELSLDADGTEVIEPGERTRAIDLIEKWIGDLRPATVSSMRSIFFAKRSRYY